MRHAARQPRSWLIFDVRQKKRAVKISRPLQVFLVLALASLSIPILLGHIPSMPRKLGHGWTPEIDMHTHPADFWSYEGWVAFTWLMFFAIYLLTKKEPNQPPEPTR